MDKIRLFVDESKAIFAEKGWDVVSIDWLTADVLNVPFADSFISTFTRLCNDQPELSQETVCKLFDTLRTFVSDVKEGKFKELIGLRYDPRLYMTEDELRVTLSDILDKKLCESANIQKKEDDFDVESFMKLMSAMQQTKPHQFGKRKKVKVARR